MKTAFRRAEQSDIVTNKNEVETVKVLENRRRIKHSCFDNYDHDPCHIFENQTLKINHLECILLELL